MPIEIQPGVVIPDEALSVHFARSGGPGGQNVNKVATKAELRVEIALIIGLTMGAVERLKQLAGKRMVDGTLLITASEHRTQLENRLAAEAKLTELVRQALIIPKARKKTRPTKASKERRIQGKLARSKVKQSRGRPSEE